MARGAGTDAPNGGGVDPNASEGEVGGYGLRILYPKTLLVQEIEHPVENRLKVTRKNSKNFDHFSTANRHVGMSAVCTLFCFSSVHGP